MSEINCCGVPESGAASCELPGLVRPARPASACPSCGQRGKAVDGQTVKALLAVSLAHVTHEPYLFCWTRDCPVVYFSADGEQAFTADQVRERVYQKEPDAPNVFVCYCFRHTPRSIRADIEAAGQSTVMEDINCHQLRSPLGEGRVGRQGQASVRDLFVQEQGKGEGHAGGLAALLTVCLRQKRPYVQRARCAQHWFSKSRMASSNSNTSALSLTWVIITWPG